jgi:Aldo/keto reductase family/Transmembrane secretion effector
MRRIEDGSNDDDNRANFGPEGALLGTLVSGMLSRAAGPALAGLVSANAGVAAVFGLNALAAIPLAVALLFWHRDDWRNDHGPRPGSAGSGAKLPRSFADRSVRRLLLDSDDLHPGSRAAIVPSRLGVGVHQDPYLQTLNGWARFVSIQDHYNLLDREEEREVYPLCADQGIGVMPWSPLARGKLTRDWNATTTRSQTDPTQDFRYESDADQAIVAKVAEIAAETRRSQGAGGSGLLLRTQLSPPRSSVPASHNTSTTPSPRSISTSLMRRWQPSRRLIGHAQRPSRCGLKDPLAHHHGLAEGGAK